MKKPKTLLFHKNAIKKACAALIRDGHNRTHAIGALIEVFIADKSNSTEFTVVMKMYLKMLDDMDKPFKPCLSSKVLIDELRSPARIVKPPFRGPKTGRDGLSVRKRRKK